MLNRTFLPTWVLLAGSTRAHAACRWHSLFVLGQVLRMCQLSNKVVDFTAAESDADGLVEADDTAASGPVPASASGPSTSAGGREHTRLDNAWTSAAVADASDLLQIEAMSRFATNDAASSELSALAVAVVHIPLWTQKILRIAVPPSCSGVDIDSIVGDGWHLDNDAAAEGAEFAYVQGSSAMLLKFALHVVARTLVVLAINSRTVQRINHFVESTLMAIRGVVAEIRRTQRQRARAFTRGGGGGGSGGSSKSRSASDASAVLDGDDQVCFLFGRYRRQTGRLVGFAYLLLSPLFYCSLMLACRPPQQLRQQQQ